MPLFVKTPLGKTGLLLALLAPTVLTGARAQADSFNFDGIPAPSVFFHVTPRAAFGPTLVYPTVTFTGGVILNQTALGAPTSGANDYATSDTGVLADGTALPGVITGTFAAPGLYDLVALDLINTGVAGKFTLTGFDTSGQVVSSQSASLPAYSLLTVSPVRLSVTGANMDYFTVTSDQTSGKQKFSVDTLHLTPDSSPVPEASGLVSLGLLLGLGIMGIVLGRRTAKSPA